MAGLRLSAAIACLVLCLVLSGCTGLDGLSSSAKADGYTPGQPVLFKGISGGSAFSGGGSAVPAFQVQVRSTIDVSSIDCTALTSSDVQCVVNATATATSSSSWFEHTWTAHFELLGQSVDFTCGPKPAGSGCLKAKTLSTLVNVTLAEPEGKATTEVKANAEGRLLGQAMAKSEARRDARVTFEIAPPGEKGMPYRSVAMNFHPFG